MDIMGINRFTSIFIAWSALYLVSTSHAYVVGREAVYGCQGKALPLVDCGEGALYDILSITVYTTGDAAKIQNANSTCITGVAECNRKILSPKDSALNPGYRYLANWIFEQCQGYRACKNESYVPEWWSLVDNHNTGCNKSTSQYIAGLHIDVQCLAGEEVPVVLITQPQTTAKTRPTTPTTTQPFGVALMVYQPSLNDQEKIILAVVIGLAAVILIVVLIILYCCERYRHHKKFSKLLAMLGAPQAQDDGFDDIADYATTEAWKDEANTTDGAIGEYTGVKPNEFMTLDKTALENSGQIMYDNFSTMTMGRGTSCSTLGRGLKSQSSSAGLVNNAYDGPPMDYETAENLELERRMAENLKDANYNEDVSYH